MSVKGNGVARSWDTGGSRKGGGKDREKKKKKGGEICSIKKSGGQKILGASSGEIKGGKKED